MLLPEWVKYTFDGVGGALLAAIAGVYLPRLFREEGKQNSAVSSQIADAHAVNSVEIERDTAQAKDSQVIQGSQNVVQVAFHNAIPGLLTFVIVLALLLGCFVYLHKLMQQMDSPSPSSSVPSGSQGTIVPDEPEPVKQSSEHVTKGVEQSHTPSTREVGPTTKPSVAAPRENLDKISIGLAFLHPDDFQVGSNKLYSCVERGTVCLAESKISAQVVDVPLVFVAKRIRVGVLVDPSGTMETCVVEVSTPDPTVTLDHSNQTDGTIHHEVKFYEEYVESVNESGAPQAFYLDVTPGRDGLVPLKITVKGGGYDTETIETTLRIADKH